MSFYEKLKRLGKSKTDLHKDWDEDKDRLVETLKKKGVKVNLKGGDFGRKIDILVEAIEELAKPSVKGKLNLLREMKKYDRAIDGVYDTYKEELEELIEAHKENRVNKKLLKELMEALVYVKENLEARLESIEDLIDSDFETALQESQRYAKGDIKPIILARHPNIAPLVAAKLTTEQKAMVEFGKLEVEVIVGDMDVLVKVDENSTEHQRAADKVDFNRMVDEIAEELKEILEEFEDDPTEREALEDQMEDIFRKKIKEGVKRGVDELSRLAGVRASYRKYKIKAAVEVTLSVAGILASVAGTAMAPITGGATVVIGMIGLFKSAVNLGKQIGKLSLEAEEMINRVRTNLKTLQDRYEDASGRLVGAAEMGSTLVNSIFGEFMDTIKEVKGDCDNIVDKIDGLEVKSGKLSHRLDTLLNAQEEYDRELGEISLEDLDDKLIKAIQKIDKALEESKTMVDVQIKKVIKLNQRVDSGRVKHKELERAVAILSKKEPTWAKVGSILIQTGVGAAFIAAGNVGGPEAYSFVGIGKDIADNIGTGLDTLDEVKSLVESAQELIEE